MDAGKLMQHFPFDLPPTWRIWIDATSAGGDDAKEYDKVSANVMISVQKMGESGQIVF